MMSEQYPERYLEGIRLFNEREFFECHDVLEDLWMETLGEEREFYQGLIQAAVALFHFETGNLGGARKMYVSARRYLLPYCPNYAGVAVEAFLADFKHCFQELLDAGNVYPHGLELDEDRLPKIEVSPDRGST